MSDNPLGAMLFFTLLALILLSTLQHKTDYSYWTPPDSTYVRNTLHTEAEFCEVDQDIYSTVTSSLGFIESGDSIKLQNSKKYAIRKYENGKLIYQRLL